MKKIRKNFRNPTFGNLRYQLIYAFTQISYAERRNALISIESVSLKMNLSVLLYQISR